MGCSFPSLLHRHRPYTNTCSGAGPRGAARAEDVLIPLLKLKWPIIWLVNTNMLSGADISFAEREGCGGKQCKGMVGKCHHAPLTGHPMTVIAKMPLFAD